MSIEDTRQEFERQITQVAQDKNYAFMDHLLRRFDDNGDYQTIWVDMAWLGWCMALKHKD